MVSLEVCANSVTSAIAAQKGGAARVELCGNLAQGGTTPSYGEILTARKHLHIKLHVLIRPRNGDFLYSALEYEIMQADIRNCIAAGCDGIVTGILKADGTIDTERCTPLVNMAKEHGLSVTFHRAFDMCADLYQALEDVIALGCDRILTSGGRSTAMEGAAVIMHLIDRAAGRIIILPGSGINDHNVADLVHFSKATEVHSSARVTVPGNMEYKNDHILLSNGLNDEYNLEFTSADKVKAILNAANGG